ncbi:HugZ family pyridoxamine 5'-phosphate oxidase [Mangrovibrevibacter kandeliae]|uniref:HugZ family pyridoxamine 5'-phosphate oxidase n=1 Tax=Mangrovibrevibacter kandeliae TaxID=2968473 RepID=UPI00222FDA01|nr:DUF2470 domain-containing protein [Aurantimonas sp. MSK8Z-1]
MISVFCASLMRCLLRRRMRGHRTFCPEPKAAARLRPAAARPVVLRGDFLPDGTDAHRSRSVMSDPELRQVPDETVRRQVRSLLRTARAATLASLEAGTGHPQATRVALATDFDGSPLLLVSRLSAHTSALLAETRCSLLVGEPGKGDPLAHPRLTVFGRALPVERDDPLHARARRRFLARQPKAELYVDFPDFLFFHLTVTRGALNGGFGRASDLASGDIVDEGANDLVDAENAVSAHMNGDHADAVDAIAAHRVGMAEAGWRLATLDRQGFELLRGDRLARVEFLTPVRTLDDVRAAFVGLTAEARETKRS